MTFFGIVQQIEIKTRNTPIREILKLFAVEVRRIPNTGSLGQEVVWSTSCADKWGEIVETPLDVSRVAPVFVQNVISFTLVTLPEVLVLGTVWNKGQLLTSSELEHPSIVANFAEILIGVELGTFCHGSDGFAFV